MKRSRSSLSGARSYKETGDFWDDHDLSDFWDKTEAVEFEVGIESERTYYALDNRLSAKLRELAWKRGVSADTLINIWVQEKLQEQDELRVRG